MTNAASSARRSSSPRISPSTWTPEQAAEARRKLAENREKLRAVGYRNAKESLYAFVKQAWQIVEPDTPMLENWHLEYLCEWLECLTFGESPDPRAAIIAGLVPEEDYFGPACDYRIGTLVINEPPGYMKSLIVTVLWPCWDWIHRPTNRDAFVSYSKELSTDHSMKRRLIIESEWYLFGMRGFWGHPTFALTGDQNVKTWFNNTRLGRMFATSTGGMITGTHYDRIVVDDPLKPDDALSEAKRETANRFHTETLSQRVRDKRKSVFVIVMQRLAEKDYTGHVLAQGGRVAHVVLQAESEPQEPERVPADVVCRCRFCRTGGGDGDFVFPRSGRVVHRKPGDVLWPEREGKAELAPIKERRTFVWAGQYQQRPRPREGGMFHRDWFEIVDVAPARARTVRFWDLAATEAKPGEDPDFCAGVKMAELDGIFYILDLVHFRGSPKAVEDRLKQTAALDGRGVPIYIEQEPGSSGKLAIDHVRRRLLKGWAVRGMRTTGSKVQRADPLAADSEAQNVKLVRGPWNEVFLEEVERFPEKGHDDIVDGSSGAHTALTRRSGRRAAAAAS